MDLQLTFIGSAMVADALLNKTILTLTSFNIGSRPAIAFEYGPVPAEYVVLGGIMGTDINNKLLPVQVLDLVYQNDVTPDDLAALQPVYVADSLIVSNQIDPNTVIIDLTIPADQYGFDIGNVLIFADGQPFAFGSLPTVMSKDLVLMTLSCVLAVGNIAAVFDSTAATPIIRALPSNMQERPVFEQFANAISEVMQVYITSPRNQLMNSRNPDGLSRTWALHLLKMLGLDIHTDILSNLDVDRLCRFITGFRAYNGTRFYVDFIAFIKDVRLTAEPLWADYTVVQGGNFSPPLVTSPPHNGDILSGGTWFQTSTIDLTYDFDKFGSQDPSVFNDLFNKFAPLHKVLRFINAGVFADTTFIYMPSTQYVHAEITTITNVSSSDLPVNPLLFSADFSASFE